MKSSLKTFAIALGICLVVFSVIAFFIVRYANGVLFEHPQDDKTDVQQEDTQKEKTQDGKDPQSKDKEINGSTFTAIIAGKDIETDELDAMIFLKVDKENKKFVVSVIPTSVEFSVDSYEGSTRYETPMRFADMVKYYNVNYFKNKMSALLGININYYAVVGVDAAKNILGTFGSVNCDVSQDMQYTSDIGSAYDIDLTRGNKNLSGAGMMQLLRFRDYDTGNGDMKRLQTQTSFIKSYLSQVLVESNKQTAIEKAATLLKNCRTDFTAQDFLNNVDLIFSYKDFELEMVSFPTAITLLDESKVVLLRSVYEKYR